MVLVAVDSGVGVRTVVAVVVAVTEAGGVMVGDGSWVAVAVVVAEGANALVSWQ